MLNFIVAKALAKKLEHRYQDTKEFASDLYACRDRIPRTSRELAKPAVVASVSRAEIVPDAKLGNINEEESKPVATLGLSSAFDSAAATMRLAALTGTKEEVNELSRTFKMPVPTMEALNKAAPTAAAPATAKPKIDPKLFAKPQNVPSTPSLNKPIEKKEVEKSGGGGMLMVVVAVVVIVAVIAVFVIKK